VSVLLLPLFLFVYKCGWPCLDLLVLSLGNQIFFNKHPQPLCTGSCDSRALFPCRSASHSNICLCLPKVWAALPESVSPLLREYTHTYLQYFCYLPSPSYQTPAITLALWLLGNDRRLNQIKPHCPTKQHMVQVEW